LHSWWRRRPSPQGNRTVFSRSWPFCRLHSALISDIQKCPILL